MEKRKRKFHEVWRMEKREEDERGKIGLLLRHLSNISMAISSVSATSGGVRDWRVAQLVCMAGFTFTSISQTLSWLSNMKSNPRRSKKPTLWLSLCLTLWKHVDMMAFILRMRVEVTQSGGRLCSLVSCSASFL
jgi:hypothetical protein